MLLKTRGSVRRPIPGSRWRGAFPAIFSLAVLLSGRTSIFAFDPATVAWSTLGREQGFSGDSISSIVQDSRGLVWMGAGNGLYRYDGQSFAAFKPDALIDSIGIPSIRCILADMRGRIWIGGSGGLLRCDTITGRFERQKLDLDREGYSSRISALAMDLEGRILAGTAEGRVWRVDPERLEATLILDSKQRRSAIAALLADARGRVWVGTDGSGLTLLDAEGGITAVYRRGGSAGPASDRITAMLEDSLGFIWIGYAEGGIDLCEEGLFRHARRAPSAKGRIPAVLCLAEDLRGLIWAGLREGGIGILDPSGMEFSIYPFAGGAEVSALLRDRRGLMWTGLKRGGLLTGDFRSTGFSRFPATGGGGKLGAVFSLAEGPSGRIFASSRDAGIVVHDPLSDSFAAAGEVRALPETRAIQALLPVADGSLWMGSAGSGLFRRGHDGGLSRFESSPDRDASLASSFILSLLPAERGKIWVGTDGEGLDLLDPWTGQAVHWGYRSGPTPPLPASVITCLTRDSKGRVWAGSADSGLFVLYPGGTRFRPAGRSEKHGEGIGGFRIECLFEDSRGRLWIGTGGSGLVAMDPESGVIVGRGSSLGLVDDTVFGVTEDRTGILWVIGSRGLFSLDTQRGDVFHFGVEDGVSGGGFEAGAILASKSGEIWLGSGEGITRFDPERIARYGPAPDVVISDIEVPGEGKPPIRSTDGSGVILEHDNIGLSFSIAVIDFAASGRNSYSMKLEGRQSAWTEMGSLNKGYIAPLAPGTYMLRVRAANGNGVWNEYGASASILVRPPWWGTWWFRTLAALLAVALVAGAVALSLRSLRRRNALLVKFARHIEEAREEERTIAARDVHDEIGQHLMVLNFNAYWLASNGDAKPEERLSVVRAMQQTIMEAMASVKAVATRLRPAGLDTLDFPDALRYYVRSFGRMSGIKTSLEIGDGWKGMSAQTAKVFFRLLQEMLSNVARHSRAKNVQVRFSADASGYLLETRDDGVGIGEGKVDAQDSFGIIGMRESCASLGGTLTISGEAGGGCRVAARLPRGREGSA